MTREEIDELKKSLKPGTKLYKVNFLVSREGTVTARMDVSTITEFTTKSKIWAIVEGTTVRTSHLLISWSLTPEAAIEKAREKVQRSISERYEEIAYYQRRRDKVDKLAQAYNPANMPGENEE